MLSLKVHKKVIKKILKNDSQILSKLNSIIMSQKQVNDHITRIEKNLNNNSNDDIDSESIKVIKMYIITEYLRIVKLRNYTKSYEVLHLRKIIKCIF